jgi:Ca2+-binding EF-hand superfamily protein
LGAEGAALELNGGALLTQDLQPTLVSVMSTGGESSDADMSLAAKYFAQIADLRQRLEQWTTADGTLSRSGAIGLAAELGFVMMDDEEDALDALSEMDQNGDGTIDPMEFEAWFKRQVLRVRPTEAAEQADVAVKVARGLSTGEFEQNVQREARKVRRAGAGGTADEPKKADARPANAHGTNAVAWAAFAKLDEDCSGTLDRAELSHLVTSLNMKMSSKALDKHFDKMDAMETGTINFDQFCVFFNAIKAKERRRLIRKLKERFHKADVRNTGLLNQDEFEQLVRNSHITLDPPFDPVADWDACKKKRTGEFPNFKYELAYPAFEAWYKERLGIDDPNIPVLPEFMVRKIEEAAFYGQQRKKWTGQTRSSTELWDSLRPRLLALVRMQQQWGKFHDIYEGSSHSSSFEYSDIPKGIRDPDSTFSAIWDLAQVILLLYVSITVPLRAGFELTVELWSFGFFWDLLIDLFFIVDIFLNFRTAFYTSTGVREERPKKIAEHYIRGWFPVDFFSSLPLAYLAYLGPEETVEVITDGSAALGGGQKGGSNTRALKALRLVRLSKMLRLARIKKVIQKYSDNIHLQTFVSIGFTIFLILFLVHILACFFYLIGTADEERIMRDGSVVVIQAWVNAEENWEPIIPDVPLVPGTPGRLRIARRTGRWLLRCLQSLCEISSSVWLLV